ncbi:ATP-binding protein [Leifsonia sp. NPDC058292]|uniref:ATP-binding protein n=1 Tax=Leifsonia sp. NPDC058292 TaxID=3346428 RepID=UPI0036DBA9C7
MTDAIGNTALSLDGRLFQFAAAPGAVIETGGVVALRSPDGVTQLGQVDEVRAAIGGPLSGSGRILGVISSDGRFDGRRSFPFSAAEMMDADRASIDAVQKTVGATLEIGTTLGDPEVAVRLLPHRFNRHTFWCGQSGSGKTYALGVVLEQLLLHTALPMVVFDPNGDFVRLREPAESPAGAAVEPAVGEIARRDIRVLRPSSPDPDSLRVRFVDLPIAAQGAVLHLDPLDDRGEFNELMHLSETLGSLQAEHIVPRLIERGTPSALALASRVENLRVIDWSVWAADYQAVTDIVETRPDATVLDLGGFTFPDEALVVAMAVLDDLWAKREQRRPLLIVIDEAHNLCSPDGTGPLHVAVRERIIQIAAEGRKFGLWLLLSTQRPSRIHPSIISQCDNLALMKMTAPGDLEELSTIFGFVPSAMFARSPGFRQGEALFAGGFVPAPTMVRMGRRLTREGGADVGVPLRASRDSIGVSS